MNLSTGWQSDFESHLYSGDGGWLFGISYSISNFHYSLGEKQIQIGLYNEIGIDNLFAYLQAGPELRLLKNIYFIPKAGIALPLIRLIHITSPASPFFYGGSAGYSYTISEPISIYLDGNVNIFPIKETQILYFFKIGISIGL